MRRKNLTASAVLAVVLFAGCGGSDKSTRNLETTTLGDSVGLSTKSVATTQQTTEVQTVSTKNTLQTGTEFTISKDIQKDVVIGKVESDKLTGEILNLSLCGDYANYFSISEDGTLKLECDLPEDFEETTLKVKADIKKDGECKKVQDKIKIKINNKINLIYVLGVSHPSGNIYSTSNKVYLQTLERKSDDTFAYKNQTLIGSFGDKNKYNMYYSYNDIPKNGYSMSSFYENTPYKGRSQSQMYASSTKEGLLSKIENDIESGECQRYPANFSGGNLNRNDNFWVYFCPKTELKTIIDTF